MGADAAGASLAGAAPCDGDTGVSILGVAERSSRSSIGAAFIARTPRTFDGQSIPLRLRGFAANSRMAVAMIDVWSQTRSCTIVPAATYGETITAGTRGP